MKSDAEAVGHLIAELGVDLANIFCGTRAGKPIYSVRYRTPDGRIGSTPNNESLRDGLTMALDATKEAKKKAELE